MTATLADRFVGLAPGAAAGVWSLVGEWDGEPNGMKFLIPGTLLVTNYKNGLMLLAIGPRS